ncbi:hypothetical protein FVE67_07325 [Thermosulfurimonas marina]|uniref:Uncharacterized protein n=1 Tax=Thermosulfurimonas marina TaxID=2047767 RepID=A0A6H1WU34_9BACT|nr:hypothetical protein [Thermosulfurimonas marina]QJA06616.1 hypothetical protein FVE67_07325 [Thermosulfurimonas marina]
MTGKGSVGNWKTWPAGLPKGLFLLGLLLLCGCGLKARTLKESSLSFNRALSEALSEQLLLNLVRLRYGEPPVFLQVTSISTQYGFSGEASVGTDIEEAYPDTYHLGLGFSYALRPTFTFAPLQGKEFARRLLSPIPVEHVVLLLNSGWRADRVLRLCVQRLNHLENAPTASGPTPTEAPRFRKFLQAVSLLEKLREAGKIQFSFAQEKGRLLPVLKVAPEARKLPTLQTVRNLLGLPPAERYYLLGPGTALGSSGIRLETRSLIGVLFYLSNGIEVPEEDLSSGKLPLTRNPDGSPFSWAEVLGDIFRIKTSRSLPEGALIAVRHRGFWFYISDRDFSTKSTFILLGQLFALEASREGGPAPLLTLPIGK